jgi:hypothetical protein
MADVVVRIDDAKIFGMASPGGMVWRWAFQRRRRVERVAKGLAPVRTGRLRESISGSYDPAPPDQVIMKVTASASYARYVHEGTGRIFPRHSKVLRIPAGNGYPKITRPSVRGQRAQPFLSEALYIVMADL